MQPTYRPGDILLGWRWFGRISQGQVVVAWVDGRLVIKRVASLGAQRMNLAGDNVAASTDSRDYGPVDRSQIEAVIAIRLGGN
jgi:phage repressor protein C with HTH and peptisase S24 domain